MSISEQQLPASSGGGSLEGGDDARRVALLRQIAAHGGAIEPRRNAAARYGYDYEGVGDPVEADLVYLAHHDYLSAKFFDRVSTCPKCSSHSLNVREVCPSCHSAHLVQEPLLHHFRCGHVGRASDFEESDGSGRLICPKCATRLRYRGTDFDQMGKTFLCLDCGAAFQDPPAEARCLSCGTDTNAGDLLSVEIVSYALTSLGAAAVRRGTLFDREAEVLYIQGAPVYRRTILLEMLGHEVRRVERFKTRFSVLVVAFQNTTGEAVDPEVEGEILSELRRRLRGTDLIGQLEDHRFVACLTQTAAKGAQNVRTRIMRVVQDRPLAVEAELFEIGGRDDLDKALGLTA